MPGNVVLITGASSDIGAALIRSLLADSPESIVLAHSFRGNARIEALEQEFNGRIVPYTADFSSPESVLAMADSISQTYGAPHAMVHLPAMRLKYERFTKLKWPDFERDLAIQVQSAGILLQRLLPKMSKLPDARVVFVLSSVVHGMPPKFMSFYTIIKYAQLGLMRALAAEYAASSVRINAISPSMVETQFLSELPPVAVEMSAGSSFAGRNATPGDLIGALLFLLSPASGYITGVDLPIAAGSVC